MTKNTVIKILKKLSEFKKNSGLLFIDTHIHPLDVMGVVHHSETKHVCHDGDYLKPGILELVGYGKIEKLLSGLYFKLLPGSVSNIIHSTYDHVNADRIVREMEVSLMDQSVLLPLDPWVPTSVMGDSYKGNKKFLLLGSLDIHSINIADIEPVIKKYIEDYQIVGLKFHPNLQNFKPQPSHNIPEIGEKLIKIYETASKYDLYLLFHGGISNYTSEIHKKYGLIERNRHNALLQNFCDLNGESELFSKYNIPIIIAHLGHYGMAKIDYKLIQLIVDKHPQVFFDTSGLSSNTISNALSFISSSRIVFGSDALYNRIAYNLAFLYNAIMKAKTSENKEDMLANMLSINFYNKILKKK